MLKESIMPTYRIGLKKNPDESESIIPLNELCAKSLFDMLSHPEKQPEYARKLYFDMLNHYPEHISNNAQICITRDDTTTTTSIMLWKEIIALAIRKESTIE